MSNTRIESWLAAQRRMVNPDGICVGRIVLVGPEGDAWGTWAIEQEDLPRAVDDCVTMQGEELPTGVYRCRLVGLDQNGNQIAMLPVRVTGRGQVTMGQGGEANALQRATGIAVGTLEQVILAQSNQIEKLVANCESLIEDRAILLEEFNKQMSENLDVQLRREEAAQQSAMRAEMWEMAKTFAPPLILPMLNAWAEEQDAKRKVKALQLQQKTQPFPPGWPGSTGKVASSDGPMWPPQSSSAPVAPPPSSSAPVAPPPSSSAPTSTDQSGAPAGAPVAPPPAIPPPEAPAAPPPGNGGSRDGSVNEEPAHCSGDDAAHPPPLGNASHDAGSSARNKRPRIRGAGSSDAKPPRRRSAGHATPTTGSG